MTTAAICLGTRASRLAVIQSTIVGNTPRARGERVEIVEITTSGDVRAPDTTWGEGAFVDALEVALRAGSIDAAVHSANGLVNRVAEYLDPGVVPPAPGQGALAVQAGPEPILSRRRQ